MKGAKVVKFQPRRIVRPRSISDDPCIIILLPVIRIERRESADSVPRKRRKRRRLPSVFGTERPFE